MAAKKASHKRTKKKTAKSSKSTSSKTKKKPGRKTTKFSTRTRKKKAKSTIEAKTTRSKSRRTRKKTATKRIRQSSIFRSEEELNEYRQLHWQELAKQKQEAERALEKYRKELRAIPEVTGIHLGFKRKNGSYCKPLRYAICIHVECKRHLSDPHCSKPIPSTLDEVPTDVVQSTFQATPGKPASAVATLTEVADPIEGGVAISTQTAPNNFGTLGFVVNFFGQAVYLTNDHVAYPAGVEIRQPPDQQALFGDDNYTGTKLIGTTLDHFGQGRSLLVDAAIILPNGERDHRRTIFGLPNPPEFFREGILTDLDLGQTAKIAGATTGIKQGIVEAISHEVVVKNQGEYINQILIRSADDSPITAAGNSGAMLFKEESNALGTFIVVVGLVHGESLDSKYVVASHFVHVKDALGIRLN